MDALLMYKISEDVLKSPEGMALLEVKAEMENGAIVTLTVAGEKK